MLALFLTITVTPETWEAGRGTSGEGTSEKEHPGKGHP